MEHDAVANADNPLRVAVVGAGPSGFYAVMALLRARDVAVAVDLFDRLPTPFGLIRAGVAPDHANIKRIARRFSRVADDTRFRFFGNVRLGRDLEVSDLLRCYHSVVLATGAERGRKLRMAGEELSGVMSATDFVYWYNGHPDFSGRAVDLSRVADAKVIGNGNVALDVARMLAHPLEVLQRTDVSPTALRAFASSRVQRVDVLGRRGPAQASFTAPEVRELAHLEGAGAWVDPDELRLSPPVRDLVEQLDGNSRPRRVLQRFAELSSSAPAEGRSIRLRFRVGVDSFVGDRGGKLRAVRLVRQRLEVADGRVTASPAGEPWEEPCQFVVAAVGYQCEGVKDVAFDEQAGTIANADGRVLSEVGGSVRAGLYVTGWARRGPSGVIGTNKPDAESVVGLLLQDASEHGIALTPLDDILKHLNSTRTEPVNWDAWRWIDHVEVSAGELRGSPREKLTTWDSLLTEARRSR